MSAVVKALLLGALTGFVAGLFGIGGGIIVVPGLILWLRFDQYHATGTSAATIVASSAAALLSFGLHGSVDWSAALLVFVGSGTGAWLGARFITRIPEHLLATVFAVILLVAGVRLWL